MKYVTDSINIIKQNKLFLQKTYQLLSGAHSRLRFGEYHYENENRNSVTYPIKGSFNEVLVEYYNGVNTDFSNFSITAKTERHFTLKPRVYLGNSVKMKFQTNTDLPYVLNESLGFEDYLRGYEYYVLDGEHFAMTKTALKYELIPKTNFKLSTVPLPVSFKVL